MTETTKKSKNKNTMSWILWILIIILIMGFLVSIYKLFWTPNCKLLGNQDMLIKFIAWWLFWPIMLFCKDGSVSPSK